MYRIPEDYIKDASGCSARVIRLASSCDVIDYLLRVAPTIVFDGFAHDYEVFDALDIRVEGQRGPSGIRSEIRYNFEGNSEIATLRG